MESYYIYRGHALRTAVGIMMLVISITGIAVRKLKTYRAKEGL